MVEYVVETTTVEEINKTKCGSNSSHQWEIDLSAKVDGLYLAIKSGDGVIEFASDGEICVVPLICKHCKITGNVKLNEDGSDGFMPLYRRELGEALA